MQKFKMAAIFEQRKFFWKLPRVHCLDTLWVESFDDITLSHTVKEIEANVCFPFLAKIQNGRHIWGEENFLKIANSTFLRYPVIENFDKLTLSRTVKEIEPNLCFSIFGKNSKIQNGSHFWGEEIFFENCQEYIGKIPYGLKISTKSLYLAQLRR